MKRISNRTWIGLMLVICLAVSAATAGFVLHLNKGSTAQAAPAPGTTTTPAAPGPPSGSTQARADLSRMQSLLNSGSVAKQAALLAPPLRFASSSGPVVPPGTTLTIRPGTLHASGNHGTVAARLSDGTAVTLGLYSVQGHWRLYGAQAGAQTSARVTGPPASARLMADVTSAGRSAAEAGTYQGVIEVHGFGESASDWDKSGMTGVIEKIPGVQVTKFDYSRVSTQWVSNQAIGPALAKYIHAVAKDSGRPVIVVGFSMGGLAIRYAATTGARAGDIAMAITIGTPNTGSFLGNTHDVLCGVSPIGLAIQVIKMPGFCTQFQAASAMAVLNPEILTLPKLPPSVPLHAIAGDWTYVFKLLGAQVAWPFFGDGVVTTGSALDKRPGWKDDTFDTVANPFVLNDMSAFHLRLTSNRNVQVLVDRYISDYLRGHPLPVPAPALGGDAYWLAGGGQWYVHGATLQISRGPSGLTGEENWNAGGQIIRGHARLAFTSRPDGSLAGMYTRDAWYTVRPQPSPGTCGICNFQPPSTPDMLKGQTITLVPVQPGLAKTTFDSNSPVAWGGGNPYWCGDGLAVANPSRYCGA